MDIMPRFSIAFISPGGNLMHRTVESPGEDEALRAFFNEINLASYTRDDEGYNYFKEDFFEAKPRNGSLLPLDPA
jgi:hypothetical protein